MEDKTTSIDTKCTQIEVSFQQLNQQLSMLNLQDSPLIANYKKTAVNSTKLTIDELEDDSEKLYCFFSMRYHELRSYFLGKTGDVSGRDKAKDLANTYSEKYRVCLEFESKKNKQGIS